MYDGYLEVCCICTGLYVVYLIIGKDCLLFTVPVCGVQKCSRKTGEQEPHATSRCCRFVLASFPGPARSSLPVRNSHRGPGLVHHVMSAAAYVTAFH